MKTDLLGAYLNKEKENKTLVSSWMDTSLVKKVDRLRKKDKLKKSELIRKLFEFYIDNHSHIKK
jgi:metal-responsive CopG/Arc/MetJ family transcriptional regulator